MKTKSSIVFVTAHPDDVAFSMGGTAALLKNEYDLHIICISSGERGYKWDGEGLPPQNPEMGAQREKEELASAELIGADVLFLHEPDGEVFAHQAVCKRVADELTKLDPVAVFTLGPFEKEDHSATCQITRQALFLSKKFWETEFYMLVPYGHTSIYNPTMYVNITDVLDEKKQQVFCHQHHLHDASYWDKLLEESRATGVLAVHCDYAEAWLTELPNVTRRWTRTARSVLLNENF